MITRREWLQKGATVAIGGALVTVGGGAKAESARAPEVVTITGMLFGPTIAKAERLVNVDVAFAADGSFVVTPLVSNPARDYPNDDEEAEPWFLGLAPLRFDADTPVRAFVDALKAIDYR